MKFCVECGTKLILKESINCGVSDGLVPYCEKCEQFRFPTYNVAVSNIIYNKDYSKGKTTKAQQKFFDATNKAFLLILQCVIILGIIIYD